MQYRILVLAVMVLCPVSASLAQSGNALTSLSLEEPRAETSLGTLSLASAAIAQTSEDLGFTSRPSGWYFNIAGMVVDQEETHLSDETGGAVDDVLTDFLGLVTSDIEASFDTGWGVRGGLGYSFENTPFSLEFEYTYRATDIDELSSPIGSVAAGGDVTSHSFMVNGIADIDLEFTDFGLYVGGGIGATISEAELNVLGVPVFAEDDDLTFSWQVFGGLKYNLSERLLLYGGVRWFDAGDAEFDILGGKNESLNYEFGLRVYF